VRVRGRLLAAFGYVLVTVILALTVPLAVTLKRRATAELETQNLVHAESLAQSIGPEGLLPASRSWLIDTVRKAANQLGGRVIVVDRRGLLLADSSGAKPGQPYADAGRPELIQALKGIPTSETRFSTDLNQTIMATAVPIIEPAEGAAGSAAPSGPAGAVRITQSLAEVDANVRRVMIGLLAIGIAGLAAGLLLAFALAGSLSKPLMRLSRAASVLGSGDLTARVGPVKGPAEVEELARSFDEMAGRLERTVKAQGEFVANASHQLRTPLTAMKLRLGAAMADAPPDRRRDLVAAEKEVDRLSSTVDRLLVTARETERSERRGTDMREACTRAFERFRERAERSGSSLRLTGNGAVAAADPTDVDQVLDNVLDNAISYAPGPIEVRCGADDGTATLEVRDHGPGISEGDMGHITERFYRGRGTRPGGSGLGLAIARELVEAAHGTLEIRNASDGGTSVEVGLPLLTGR
jgi:signal transduction histidine kinase